MAINLLLTTTLATNGVKILTYGGAGVGKTTLIPTLPNPVILSAEGGLLSIKDADLPYIEISTMEELREAYSWLKNSDEAKQFESVAIDSISEIAEVCLGHEKAKAKDPRQAYGEMQTTMAEAIRSFRDLPARHVYMTAKLEKAQAGWAEKAALALSKDREDLAKAALIEKQKAGDMAAQLEGEIAELDDALQASEEDIQKLQAKLQEARARQASLTKRMEGAQNRARMREMYSGERTRDAFARFEMLERRVDLAEGHAESLAMGAQPKSLEEEIAELRMSDQVEAELEALKAAQGKTAPKADEAEG